MSFETTIRQLPTFITLVFSKSTSKKWSLSIQATALTRDVEVLFEDVEGDYERSEQRFVLNCVPSLYVGEGRG